MELEKLFNQLHVSHIEECTDDNDEPQAYKWVTSQGDFVFTKSHVMRHVIDNGLFIDDVMDKPNSTLKVLEDCIRDNQSKILSVGFSKSVRSAAFAVAFLIIMFIVIRGLGI